MPPKRLVPPGCVFVRTADGQVRQVPPPVAAPLLALHRARLATPAEIATWAAGQTAGQVA